MAPDMGSPPVNRSIVERPALGRLKAAAPAVVLSAAFAHNLYASWLKWGNVIIDGGREFDLPRRLAEGEALYAHLRYYYGPLAPYANMALYRLGGVHANVLIGAGIASAALMCLVVYCLARRFMGPAASTLMGVVYLYTCAFAHLLDNPSFNFVIPYTYAATYGMLAAASSLLFLVRYAATNRALDLLLSTTCLALAALAKVEVLVPSLAAHAVWLATTAAEGGLSGRKLAAYAIPIGVVGGCYGTLAARTGAALWTDNLGGLMNRASSAYIARTLGVSHVWGSLEYVGISSVTFALAAGSALGLGWLVQSGRLSSKRLWQPMLAGGGLTALAYAVLPPTIAYRVLTPLAITAWGVCLFRWWRLRTDRPSILPDLLVWAFVLGCLARIPLRAMPHHYGFYLLPVPLVGVGVVLFRYLPSLWRENRGARAVTSAVASGVLVGSTFQCFAISYHMYARHRVLLQTEQGKLLLMESPWNEPALVGFLSRFPRTTRVLVVPQGIGLVFFAGLQTAGGMSSYLPMEFSGAYGDEGILARWQASPPDLVLILRQDMEEFGFRGFGVDYGQKCFAWLMDHYHPITDPRQDAVFYSPNGAPAAARPAGPLRRASTRPG
jgi:hypothetical protein